MKKIMPIIMAVVSGFVVDTALAKSEAEPYLGLELGYGRIEDPEFTIEYTNDGGEISQSSRHLAGRLYGGLLWQRQSLAYGIETGAALYSRTENKLVGRGYTHYLLYSGWHVDLLAVGEYRFTANWRLVAKAGLALVHERTEVHGLNEAKDRVLPKISAGVAYQQANSPWRFSLSYSHVFGEDPVCYGKSGNFKDPNDITKVASVTMVTLGLTYYF